MKGLQQVPWSRRTDTTDLLDFDSEDAVLIGTPPAKQSMLSTFDRGTYRDGGGGDEGFSSVEAAIQAEEELREARQATALVAGFQGNVSSLTGDYFPLLVGGKLPSFKPGEKGCM